MTAKVSINNNRVVCGAILSVTKLQNGNIRVNYDRVELTAGGSPKENHLGVISATMTPEEFSRINQEIKHQEK